MNNRFFVSGVLVFFFASTMYAGKFTTLDFHHAANVSRMDEVAQDQKGGWLDQGNHDLRLLSAGRHLFSSIPFDLLPSVSESDKGCIVLRKSLSDEVTLSVSQVSGNSLYLLHACDESPDPKQLKMIGEMEVSFSDGTKQEFHIRAGRDVGNWTDPTSFQNAVRCWTTYNQRTQVSLFLSRFSLKSSEKIVSIEFEREDDFPKTSWMILAATVGDREKLVPIRSNMSLTEKLESPPPLETSLSLAPAGARPKNVILIIGDGMGRGALELTSRYQYHQDQKLFFSSFPVATLCTTYSANSDVTDSAASGTALATGFKTSNGVLGLRIVDKNTRESPEMLLSYAQRGFSIGKSVGLVTSDVLTGATPAAFYAHVKSRGEAEHIAEQASVSGYQVLIGKADSEAFFLPAGNHGKGKRKDGRNLVAEMEKRGYATVRNLKDFPSPASGKKILGFWEDFKGERTIGEAMSASFSVLEKNPKGFFMMAECYLTDAGGHGNIPSSTVRGTVQVEWMARAALMYALQKKDTLVVITADHETGGIQSMMSGHAPHKIVVKYMTTNHTGVPVALYAYGPGAEQFEGLLDNTDVAKIISHFILEN